jgi:hypothetical protein
MTQPTHPSKLDLMHKGIYPGIAVALMVFNVSFAVFVYWNNNDKQRQIDRLQAEIQSVQGQVLAAEKNRQEAERRAEEDAHRMRVELYKIALTSRTSIIDNAEDVRALFAIRFAALGREDRKRFGEDKASDLWEKARKQAEKEVKSETIDYLVVSYSRCTAFQILGARQVTDVLLLEFACLGPAAEKLSLVQTLGFAMQRAGCRLLGLDTREMGLLPVPSGQGGHEWAVVLYDNVPGGAGHVRELVELAGELFVEARRVLYVSDAHHNGCETACLECLLSFDAQAAMARAGFDRLEALRWLDRMLEGSVGV